MSIKIIRHHIKKAHPLWKECDFLSYVSKNLYNKALYELRQFALKGSGLFIDRGYGIASAVQGNENNEKKVPLHGVKDGKSVGLYQITQLLQVLRDQPEYRTTKHTEYGSREVNTKILKQTLRQLEADFVTYFKSVKACKENKGKAGGDLGPKTVRLPGYKRAGPKGRCVVTIPKEALSVYEKKGSPSNTGIRLYELAFSPKSSCIRLDTTLCKEQILEAKIVPTTSGGYDILISYVDAKTAGLSKAIKDAQGNKMISAWQAHKKEEKRKQKEQQKLTNDQKIASAKRRAQTAGRKLVVVGADAGINNLVTLTFSDPSAGKFISKPVIINGRHIKSINWFYNKRVAEHQSKIAKGGIKSCKKIKRWTDERNRKMSSALHQVSRFIVNYLMATFDPSEFDLVFVIGVNKGWKQEVHLGAKTNQNFVQIPFYTLRHQLEYKLSEAHIEYLEQEESYTSKCSFIDNEPMGKRDVYAGKRVHRGLFKSKDGVLIHADVNGSGNIARKACAQGWGEQPVKGLSNFVWGLSVNPKRITLKENEGFRDACHKSI